MSRVNVVIPPLPEPLTYLVPDGVASQITIGSRVEVPLGKRRATGFVIGLNASAPTDPRGNALILKDLAIGREGSYGFSPEQLTFFHWVAEYYGDSLASVIDVAVPPVLKPKPERYVHLVPSAEKILSGSSQRKVLEMLLEGNGSLPYHTLSQKIRGFAAVAKRLLASGYIHIEERDSIQWHLASEPTPTWAKDTVQLNEPQSRAVDEVARASAAKSFETYLLHGVTGSGKTEVYIEAIKKVRAAGLGALVIVPEIALTPQLIDRFRVRLGDKIAVLHSGLNRRTRWDSWRALLEGKAPIAIGARSAVFAPMANLGIIVVDEEHDSSYKQGDGLRYNARDLAVLRGKFHQCPVVLGSATPSLETFHNAAEKRYRYVELPAAYRSAQPSRIDIIDLNKLKPWELPSKNISPIFLQELAATIARDEQAFILYNRRGFASYLQCEKCEASLGCPNCSVTFTYHQKNNSLLCHYCGLSTVPPLVCPSCPAGAPLVHRGAGTERVLDEIQQLFPHVAIERLDRDAVTTIQEYKAVLDRVRKGETKILVGTQMIAKGHDLPNVTFVGVVDCDIGLHMPDFRASERVYQLLTQVAGRAGRADKAGVVILQTRVPHHPALLRTQDKNFRSFAEGELRTRKELGYPPFTKLLRIIATSPDRELALEELKRVRLLASQVIEKERIEGRILGPVGCPLAKLRASWRYHLICKASRSSSLLKILRALGSRGQRSTKVRIAYDMDPQDML